MESESYAIEVAKNKANLIRERIKGLGTLNFVNSILTRRRYSICFGIDQKRQ